MKIIDKDFNTVTYEGPVVLQRHVNLPNSVKRITKGPAPGGRFWAIEGANDLPPFPESNFVTLPLATLLANKCEVYIREYFRGNWKRVLSEKQIPDITVEWRDNYEACNTEVIYAPLIELYVIGHGGGELLTGRYTLIED